MSARRSAHTWRTSDHTDVDIRPPPPFFGSRAEAAGGEPRRKVNCPRSPFEESSAKYLAPQVYNSIFSGRQEVRIASQRKKPTMCFSDIAGFTETSDKMESEDLTYLLNHYLTEMSKIAADYGATIDQYVGDGIVMFFGDPETRGPKRTRSPVLQWRSPCRGESDELAQVWRDAGIADAAPLPDRHPH